MTGPDGLLKQLTKTALEAALNLWARLLDLAWLVESSEAEIIPE